MPHRIHGVDAARGLAIIGMILAHTIPASSRLYSLAPLGVIHGRSAALFAVVAGISLGFITGNNHRGESVRIQVARISGRALALIPLAVFTMMLPARVYTILGSYALWFVLVLPLLYAPVALLIATSVVLIFGAWAAVVWWGPIEIPLVTTSAYPAITYLAYLLIGLAVAHFDIRRSSTRAALAGIGLILAAVPLAVWMSLGGNLSRAIAWPQRPGFPVASNAGELVLFAADILPHCDSPAQVIHAAGCALVIISLCVTIAMRIPALIVVLAVPGTVALSIYVGHLVILALVAERSARLGVGLVVVMVAAAFVWRAVFQRGPLEHYVALISRLAGRLAASNS
ncbi:MAG: heparan-alpha-glucosaminide N-acetyltransferase domain-containing protein [Bowdeniella nasicola]|nr:heparan-alpha-glucosaminide N-acetyltransferase domain-containing protein [Bowdeniella nasicola]